MKPKMITSEKEFEEFLLGPVVKHARLVERGVPTRTAFECVVGKKESDKIINNLDRLDGKPKSINELNN